jgi:hypothetical protein
MYRPQVNNPALRLQTKSSGFQTPFFFGGSQTPINLNLPSTIYSGSGVFLKEHSMPDNKKIQYDKGKYNIKTFKMPLF